MNPFDIYPIAPEPRVVQTVKALGDLLAALAVAQQNVRDADERADYSYNNDDPDKAAEFICLAEKARDIVDEVEREYQAINAVFSSTFN